LKKVEKFTKSGNLGCSVSLVDANNQGIGHVGNGYQCPWVTDDQVVHWLKILGISYFQI
jgi:hypothetical protein